MVSAFIVDLMALIRQLTEIPKTYEGLTWKILESLPVGYSKVDIVADTYRKISKQQNERQEGFQVRSTLRLQSH